MNLFGIEDWLGGAIVAIAVFIGESATSTLVRHSPECFNR
jgi:hypothetical protein